MFALIDGNQKVIDVQNTKTIVADVLTWVNIPSGIIVKIGFTYTNGQFVDPNYSTLDVAKTTQKSILNNSCMSLILSGFLSSALGEANTYASVMLDQQNLIQAAQNSNGGLLSVNTANGWQLIHHTQAEAQQVLADFITFKDNNRSKLATYVYNVNAATSINEIQSIVWS